MQPGAASIIIFKPADQKQLLKFQDGLRGGGMVEEMGSIPHSPHSVMSFALDHTESLALIYLAHILPHAVLALLLA